MAQFRHHFDINYFFSRNFVKVTIIDIIGIFNQLCYENTANPIA
jgi:hypothetical protein